MLFRNTFKPFTAYQELSLFSGKSIPLKKPNLYDISLSTSLTENELMFLR